MIAAMHGSCHCVRLLRGGNPEGDRQHDGVAVGHNRRLHGVFGIMAVGNGDIIGERRPCQMRADRADIDDMMRHVQTHGTGGGKIQLLFVALAIVEGEKR